MLNQVFCCEFTACLLEATVGRRNVGRREATNIRTFCKHNMLLPNMPAPLPVDWLKRLGINDILGVKVEVTVNSGVDVVPILDLDSQDIIDSQALQPIHR
jgi:hypothetical protein